MARIGLPASPCVSAIAIACPLSSRARATERSAASTAKWPRQAISTHGRPIRRASATPSSRCRRASSTRNDHSSATPRSISATARMSLLNATSPAGCASDAASSDCISSSTAVRSPRRRATVSRPTPNCRSKWRRRSSGTVAARRSATARCGAASSSEPRSSSTPAATAASSASPAGASAGKAASSARVVAPRPSSARLVRLSKSRRVACAHSPAACACSIASTTYPCSANHWAAARCSGPTSSGAVLRSSSRSRSANRWW